MTDEIIEEIHAVRRNHAASFDFDVKRIIADLRNLERIHTEQGWPLVQAPTRLVVLEENGSKLEFR